ncbi:MAG TPA: hypothetical protein VMF88_10730 [Bacteroidota bacterium]|nr:hypothetical protein [Bacteroidota bacterium]
MLSSLDFISPHDNQLLFEGENKDDLATGADLILEFRNPQGFKEAPKKEFALVFGMLCLILIGSPRKHRNYRLKTYALREQFLPGIAEDLNKRAVFQSSFRPALKELRNDNLHTLDDFDQFFDSRILGLKVEDPFVEEPFIVKIRVPFSKRELTL